MLKALGFVVVVALAVLALVIAAAVMIAVVRLVAAGLIIFSAAAVAGALGWVAAAMVGAEQPAIYGVAAAVVGFIVALVKLTRTEDLAPIPNAPPAKLARGETEQKATERLEPDSDAAVREAWERALELFPLQEEELRKARRGCARLLWAADEAPLDEKLLETAVLVRRHVPELVQRTAKLIQDVDPPEQVELATEMMRSLSAIGARATAALADYRSEERDRLSAHHLHVRRGE